MNFLRGVLKWTCLILVALLLGAIALALIIGAVLLPFAFFIAPGIWVYHTTNSIGWGLIVSLAILIVEAVVASATIIELTLKTVRAIVKVTMLLWDVVAEMVKELFE